VADERETWMSKWEEDEFDVCIFLYQNMKVGEMTAIVQVCYLPMNADKCLFAPMKC
jgi:hypothetical protein